AAYGKEAPLLAVGLYDQIFETDWDTARLLLAHFQGQSTVGYYNHQASLVGRIPTLPLDELSEFLKSVKRHVCLIVSRGPDGRVVRGTGFLVAPSLVLTCQHVLESFPEPPSVFPNGSCIELYFDFYYGEPVDDVGPHLPHARKVGLAEKWLVESRRHVIPD